MKVLIMSHNPITDYNSMGKTFLGLFSAFPEEDLCQFYIYPTLPNIKVCNSYYRITDREALRSIFFRGNSGRCISDDEIKHENTLYENDNSSKIYRDKSSHKELKILVRDAIWKLATIKNRRLSFWLSEEKPSVIFAAPGASGFFYKLILRIAKNLNIPIVTYVCDDFYFSNRIKKGLAKRIYARYIRKKIKRLLEESRHVITISEELAQDYAAEFGCQCTVISTGANLKKAQSPICGDGKVLSYFGNLQLGRYLSLAEVAKAVDLYNGKHGSSVVLNIYTADCSPHVLEPFKGIMCARFCGFLPADNMYAEMRKSSVLLHIESFDNENRERVKYSVSTKIADSLASGICVLAYGPEGLASIEYLRRNECAFVANNGAELESELSECLGNPEARNKTATKALDVAARNHDSLRQSEHLKSILLKVII